MPLDVRKDPVGVLRRRARRRREGPTPPLQRAALPLRSPQATPCQQRPPRAAPRSPRPELARLPHARRLDLPRPTRHPSAQPRRLTSSRHPFRPFRTTARRSAPRGPCLRGASRRAPGSTGPSTASGWGLCEPGTRHPRRQPESHQRRAEERLRGRVGLVPEPADESAQTILEVHARIVAQ
jgi:hypothetical protein